MFLTVKTPGRIGDFLKELKLTEGKNTGFRKIRNAMEVNGSPAPIFITDDERVQFITRLKIHPKFEPLNEPISEPIKSEIIFHFIELNPNCKRADIQESSLRSLKTNFTS